MKYGTKELGPIKLSDFKGGLATAYPPHSIDDNQVSDCTNAIFEEMGCTRAPGLSGVTDSTMFPGPIRGWFKYVLPNGAEYKLAVSGQQLYSVDLSDGSLTSLYTLSSDNECYAVNFRGKLWIVNGVDSIKVESDLSVYRIGLAAPTGFTAAAVGGGSLPAGDYAVYASYSRSVDGTTVIHSAPQTIDTITVDGTQGIAVIVTESSDPQVDKITVWMTAAGGADPYWYTEDDNATGTITILSDTSNSDLLMYEQAAGNQLPQSLNNIFAIGNRLFGIVNDSNNIYYSYYCQSVYDCERWPTEYYIPTIPFTALSLFGVGIDIFVNTVFGIYKFEGGDLTVRPDPIVQGEDNSQIFYFPKNMLKTVRKYNNVIFGITNDGFRYFDGTEFSIDLSKHIKPEIDTIVNDSGVYNPYGIVFRRSGKRTEYQISYIDSKYSSNSHNRTIVLNLDRLVVIDNDNYRSPWEKWTYGYSHAIVTLDNKLYVAQYSEYYGHIAQHTGYSLINCLNQSGQFITEVENLRLYVKTKMHIIELAGQDRWQRLYYLASLGYDCLIKLLIIDQNNYRDVMTMSSTGGDAPVLDVPGSPLILPFVLNAESYINSFSKCKVSTKGNSFFLEIDQTADDEIFEIRQIELHGVHERNAYT